MAELVDAADANSAEGNLVGVRLPPGTIYRVITKSLIGWGTLFLSSLLVLSRGLDIKPNPRRNIDPKGLPVGQDLAGNGRSTDPFSRPFAATMRRENMSDAKVLSPEISCTLQSASSSPSSRSSPSSACSTMAAPSPSSRAIARRPPATSTRFRSATSRRS